MKNHSIFELNHLPLADRTRIFRALIPPAIFSRLGIDRETLLNRRGEKSVQFHTPESHGFVSIDVKENLDDRDSIFFLQLSDTPFLDNLELSFLVINDPGGGRYDIDRDLQGRDTLFGTASRNIPEEERAMRAGLAPGQVRPGLRLFGELIRLLERFASRLGTSIISCEALFYHNAIQYERHGFGYLEGRKMMEEIDRNFSPGESFLPKMNDSSPFRKRGGEKTVRGRSWAVQDGILEPPWTSPKLYKPVGKSVGVSTFHGQGY